MFSAASLLARRTGFHAQRRLGSLASNPSLHRSLNRISGINFKTTTPYLRTFATEKPDLPPLPPTPPKGSPAAHPANQLKGHVNDAQGRYYRDWGWNKYINIESVAIALAVAVFGYGTIVVGDRFGLWRRLGVEEYIPGLVGRESDKAEPDEATKNARDPYQATVTDIVYFDVVIDSEEVGRITLGLFGDVAPKTVKNFKSICEGFKREGKERFSTLTYAGSPFHRVIPGFMIQAGDITRGNGTGGMSIYGRTFEDETFKLKHRQGVLSMANAGKDTNASQFFITLTKTDWLDDHHVVFGRVLDGVETVMAVSRFGTRSGKPSRTIVISQCGVLEPDEELGNKIPNFHWNQ